MYIKYGTPYLFSDPSTSVQTSTHSSDNSASSLSSVGLLISCWSCLPSSRTKHMFGFSSFKILCRRSYRPTFLRKPSTPRTSVFAIDTRSASTSRNQFFWFVKIDVNSFHFFVIVWMRSRCSAALSAMTYVKPSSSACRLWHRWRVDTSTRSLRAFNIAWWPPMSSKYFYRNIQITFNGS